MSSYGFDPEQYARELEGFGVPHETASAQAAAMSKALLLPQEPPLTARHFELLMHRFGFLEQRLELLDRRFETVDRRFEQVDQRLDKLDHRFEVLEEQQKQVDGRLHAHDQRFTVVEQRLNLHTWMLGLIILTLVVPQLQAWFALP